VSADPPDFDLDSPEPPSGYTRASWEMTRLQFRHAQPGRSRPDDRTLPGKRLVEFRCRGDQTGRVHHVLAVIYQSPSGPLAVSTAVVKWDRETLIEMNKHHRETLAEFGKEPKARKLPWNPNPRLIEVDEMFSDEPMPLNCRCGDWPELTHDHLKLAVDAYARTHQKKALVVGVSSRGLHSAPDTLYTTF
jgi:hypothetical protein